MKKKRQSAMTVTFFLLAVLTAAVSLTQAFTITPAVDKSIERQTKATRPVIRYVLKELLNVPKRSLDAAIFEINGVNTRVYVGEGIGSSGWYLVEVTRGEALIRRNGEVRSIYVGQQF
jgi:hypothetical protein